jgi:hypothetical protein
MPASQSCSGGGEAPQGGGRACQGTCHCHSASANAKDTLIVIKQAWQFAFISCDLIHECIHDLTCVKSGPMFTALHTEPGPRNHGTITQMRKECWPARWLRHKQCP